MARLRLAASGCIDGVAAAGLHAPAACHDDERIDGLLPVAVLQPALLSSRRIDLTLSAVTYYEWKA